MPPLPVQQSFRKDRLRREAPERALAAADVEPAAAEPERLEAMDLRRRLLKGRPRLLQIFRSTAGFRWF